MKLAQEVAIITGASRGIGKAIAQKLSAEGAKLVLSGRSEDVKQTAAEINAAGGTAVAVLGDVSRREACEELIETALTTFGRIDILVNNAGITKDNLLLRMTEADWDTVLNINLKGTFLCTKTVLKPMMKQRSGKIINIASVVGLTGNVGQANYAASKGGVIAFTRTMAKELGSRNIRVNAIAPGFIETSMTEVLSDETKANLLQTVPLGCLGKPEDVAEAVAFLVSPAATYITGQVLNVDGGMAMQ